ncbi:WhiB family transcriptional regulator [Streptomyces sp. STR69]|uniref:WhiB family transcriptional regulator n=1 Tax=Streptomyces sp. STR69 TaxID=1796942 RepID=UPI0021C6BFEF|nr:WhiB family transcriptional regulator [Streptomyces sp. STR69]
MSQSTEPTTDWRKFAICREVDDDTFFPGPGDIRGINYAKEICAGCPVARPCLISALREEGGRAKSNRFGVRGGKSAGQRYAMYTAYRRQQQRAAA